MKILIFDNYDSFTYNLVHLVEKITHERVDVYRNDQIPLERVQTYDKIILSPGPGIPSEAGLLLPLIKEYAATKPILGVCLGHQAIGEAFGGKLENLSTVYHGVATPIHLVNGDPIAIGLSEVSKGSSLAKDSPLTTHDSRFTIHDSRNNLFRDIPATFEAGRYHSWIVSDEGFPKELEVTARDDNNYIMAMRHRQYDVQGVQFHPESVLTPIGEKIVINWLRE
jgi:anthranilate synthase component 2